MIEISIFPVQRSSHIRCEWIKTSQNFKMYEMLQNLPANVVGRLAVVNTIRDENTWKEEAAEQKSFDMCAAIRNELHSSPNSFLAVWASHWTRRSPEAKTRSIWKYFGIEHLSLISSK